MPGQQEKELIFTVLQERLSAVIVGRGHVTPNVNIETPARSSLVFLGWTRRCIVAALGSTKKLMRSGGCRDPDSNLRTESGIVVGPEMETISFHDIQVNEAKIEEFLRRNIGLICHLGNLRSSRALSARVGSP